MKVALIGSIFPDKTESAEQQILDVCHLIKKYGMSLYLPETFFNSLSSCSRDELIKLCTLFDALPSVDMAVSVGGDGTFLRTAATVGNSGIPILGINTGRLGFLAAINFSDVEATLLDIERGNYIIEKRSLLKLNATNTPIEPGFNTTALNEVAVMKQDTSSMMTIHAFIDNDFLTSYQADGLIIATPSGSTAYSMSVGGPILVPNSPSFILSPISPHNLTSRPLVIGDNSKIRLTIESRSHNFLVSLDGQSQIFNENSVIEIEKADFVLNVVTRVGHTFFETLRDKLMWGVDVRR